jgi:signal transduction histidine kinase
MNLFFNAADATADNGFIRIDVKSGKNSVAEIRVIDNGKGIPEEDRLRIFDPFFSSKGMTGGIGLGLSVSLSLARSFNGNLILESSDENGSAFLLTVPLIEG